MYATVTRNDVQQTQTITNKPVYYRPMTTNRTFDQPITSSGEVFGTKTQLDDKTFQTSQQLSSLKNVRIPSITGGMTRSQTINAGPISSESLKNVYVPAIVKVKKDSELASMYANTQQLDTLKNFRFGSEKQVNRQVEAQKQVEPIEVKREKQKQIKDFFRALQETIAQAHNQQSQVAFVERTLKSHQDLVHNLESDVQKLTTELNNTPETERVKRLWTRMRLNEVTKILNDVKLSVIASEEKLKQEVAKMDTITGEQKQKLQQIDGLKKEVAILRRNYETNAKNLQNKSEDIVQAGQLVQTEIQKEIGVRVDAINELKANLGITEAELKAKESAFIRQTLIEQDKMIRQVHVNAAKAGREASLRSLEQEYQNLSRQRTVDAPVLANTYKKTLDIMKIYNENATIADINKFISVIETTEINKAEEVGRANQTVNQLQTQVAQLQQELRKQTTEKENEILKLRNDVKLKDQQIQILNTKQITDEQIRELNNLKSQNAKLQRDLAYERGNLAIYKKGLEEAQQEIQELQILVDDHAEQLQNLRTSSSSNSRNNEVIKQHNAQLQQQLANMQREKAQLEQQYKANLSNEQKLKELLDQGVLSQQALEKIMPVKNPAPTAETLKQIEDLKKREQTLILERDTMKNTIDSLTRQVQTAQQQIASVTSGSASAAQIQVEQYKTMLTTVLRKLSNDTSITLGTTEAQAEEALQNALKRIEEPYKTQITTMNNQLTELRDRVTTSTSSLNAAQERIVQLETTLQNVTKSGNVSSQQIASLQQTILNTSAQYNAAVDALKQSQARESAANATVQQLRTELTKKATEAAEENRRLVDTQNSAVKALNDQFAKDREVLAAQYQAEIQRKQLEMDQIMKNTLEQKEAQIVSLNATVENLTETVKSVKKVKDDIFEELKLQADKLTAVQTELQSISDARVLASYTMKLLEDTTGVVYDKKVNADGSVEYALDANGYPVIKKGAATAYAEKSAGNIIQQAYGLGVLTRVRGTNGLADRYVLDNQVTNQAKENARKFLIDYFTEIWDYNDRILQRPLTPDEASRRNEARFKFINENLDTWGKVGDYIQRAEKNPEAMLNEYNSILKAQQNGGAPGLQNYAKAKADYDTKYGLTKALDHKVNPNDLMNEYFTSGIVLTSGGFRKAAKK